MRRGIVASAYVAPPPPVLTYRGSSSWSGSVITFDIGDPSPNRQVIVVASTAENNWPVWRSNPGTIGGVSATWDADYPSDRYSAAVVRATVPNGTTAAVSLRDAYGISYMVWTVSAPVNVVAVASAPVVGASLTQTLDSPPLGFVIAYVLGNGATFSAPLTSRGRSFWGGGADAMTTDTTATLTVNGDTTNRALFVTYAPA